MADNPRRCETCTFLREAKPRQDDYLTCSWSPPEFATPMTAYGLRFDRLMKSQTTFDAVENRILKLQTRGHVDGTAPMFKSMPGYHEKAGSGCPCWEEKTHG